MVHRRKWYGLGLASAVCAILLVSGQPATAGVGKKVQRSFRGKILITAGPLPALDENPKSAIKQLKALHKSSVTHRKIEGAATWTFHYTAFLKSKLKVADLTLDFHKADKSKAYVANARLTVEPGLTIVSGELTIDENEGPNPGTTYSVILRTRAGKEIDLARTKLTLN